MAGVDYKLIEQAAAILREAGATEVYLFGSALDGTMDDYSDIDIAVKGLPSELYFPMLSKASDILPRPLDLIDLDEHSPLVDYLLRSGAMQRVC